MPICFVDKTHKHCSPDKFHIRQSSSCLDDILEYVFDLLIEKLWVGKWKTLNEMNIELLAGMQLAGKQKRAHSP